MHLEDAHRATRAAAGLAAFQTVVTALVLLAAPAVANMASASWLDVAVLAGAGVAAWRHSRVGHVVLIAMTVVSALLKLVAMAGGTGAPVASLGMAVAFGTVYVRGFIGARAIYAHRLAREEVRPAPVWLKVVGGVGALLFASLLGFGFLLEVGVYHDGVVTAGEDVDASTLQDLRDAGLLEDGDELAWFYTDGISDVTVGGCLLTDSALVVWWRDEEDAIAHGRVPFGQVVAVETLAPNVFGVRTILIDDYEWSYTCAPVVDSGGDQRFIDALREAAGLPDAPDLAELPELLVE